MCLWERQKNVKQYNLISFIALYTWMFEGDEQEGGRAGERVHFDVRGGEVQAGRVRT